MGILSFIVFLFIFGSIVMIHEWGHFTAARKNGIKVEEFGMGLPPKIWGKKKGETLYSINLIPFGGFVRMFGEDLMEEGAVAKPRSFASKSIPARMVVVLAGVFMNFVLAVVLLTGLFIYGMKPLSIVPDEASNIKGSYMLMSESYAKELGLYSTREGMDKYPGVPVMAISAGGGAEEAGIVAGDILNSVNGESVGDVKSITDIISGMKGKSVPMKVWRDSSEVRVLVPVSDSGKMGVSLGSNGTYNLEDYSAKFAWYKAPWEAVKEIGRISEGSVRMVGSVFAKIVTKLEVSDSVSGPVGIYSVTDQLVKSKSVMSLLQLAALLSTSLAVFNVLPFPALDGGRFMFLIYELIFRKRASVKIETYTNLVGILCLLGLLFIVTFKDIMRMF